MNLHAVIANCDCYRFDCSHAKQGIELVQTPTWVTNMIIVDPYVDGLRRWKDTAARYAAYLGYVAQELFNSGDREGAGIYDEARRDFEALVNRVSEEGGRLEFYAL